MPTFLEIDGSHGEGGGAILRVATALSVLTKRPVRVTKIRAARKKSGLQTQHLEGLKALADLCGAELKGAALGSTAIEFVPDEIQNRNIEINIPTAGSIGLILQTLQLACVHAPFPVDIKINGGADFGKFAPPIPYLQNATLSLLKKMGYEIDLKTLRHGFYPKGGGLTEIRINPTSKLKPLRLLEQGTITQIMGLSIAEKSLAKAKVAERQASAARGMILEKLKIEPRFETRYVEAACPGSGIVIWAATDSGSILGGDAIGERGLLAEKVGEAAAERFVEDVLTGAAVDRHAADQLIPFMALAPGSSIRVAQVTKHASTNIWVAEQFLKARFRVEEKGRIISSE